MSRKTTNLTTMKRFFLMALMIFTITSIYSQTEKGKMLLGGQFNFSGSNNNSKYETSKSNGESYHFTLAPNYGYFISNNFVIGARLSLGASNSWNDYNRDSNTIIEGSESHYSNYGFGAFVRRYVSVNEKFRFYLGAGINYNSSTLKSSYNYFYGDQSRTQDNESFRLAVAPGIVYFVTPRIGFEAQFGSLYYQRTSSETEEIDYEGVKTNDSSDDNGFGLNLDTTSFYLGLNYYF